MAVAYDCPYTFTTYILFFHQALYIKNMTTNLISPFQMQAFGVTVNEIPLQHLNSDSRTSMVHSIQHDEMHIPLELKGIMSGFVTRKPTALEIHDTSGACGVHVHLTSEASWEIRLWWPHHQSLS